MKAFMHAAPHGPAMRKLLNWCDEAALVRWTQAGADLAHVFPAPVVRKSGALNFK